MTCTVAVIIAAIGYMPPKGTVITVPKEQAAQYTLVQQAKAIACARRYGIELKVIE
jgi:hypothetical protein